MTPQMTVHFKPWIGPHYQKASLFGKRILVLGESHYGDGAANKSIHLIQETIKGNFSHPFYTKLALSFLEEKNAHALTLVRKQFFWNSVAYTNFVQTHLEGARQAPSAAMWEAGRDAFFELLEILKPDFVLVCGYRLWEQLPTKHQKIKENTNGFHLANYQFKGVDAVCMRCKHPSSNYSSNDVYSVIRNVVSDKKNNE